MTEHVWDLTGAEPVWRPLTDEEKAKLRAANPNIRFVDAEVNGRRTRAALFTEPSGQTYVSAGEAQTIDWAQPSDLTSWQPDASNGSAELTARTVAAAAQFVAKQMGADPMDSPNPLPSRPWPDPTPEMLASPAFDAVWQAIKGWDIHVPGAYGGYCGATGNHVRAILDALGVGAPAAPSSFPANALATPAKRIDGR